MGLSAFNLMRARLQAEEEARKAKELEELAFSPKVEAPVVVETIEEPKPVVEKPKRKKTDAEKLKSKKN